MKYYLYIIISLTAKPYEIRQRRRPAVVHLYGRDLRTALDDIVYDILLVKRMGSLVENLYGV